MDVDQPSTPKVSEDDKMDVDEDAKKDGKAEGEESTPAAETSKKKVEKEKAEEAKSKLEEAGASVSLK